MKNNFIKIISIFILSFICIFTLTACKENNSKQTNENNDNQSKLSLGGSYVGNDTSYFIKIDGIDGESNNIKHDKWIDVIDFTCGTTLINNEKTYIPVEFSHKVDRSTPIIQNYCMTGKLIRNVEFSATKNILGTESEILKINFTDVKIVDFEVQSVTDSRGASYLIEKVSMFVDTQTFTSVNTDNSTINNEFAYYIRLDGIDGSSNDNIHNKWIDVIDISYSGKQTEYPDMPVYGKDGELGAIVFTHEVDAATPKLQGKYAGYSLSGQLDASKSIAGRKTNIYSVCFEVARIEKAIIKTVTDENGKSHLIEEITIKCEKEKWTYNMYGIDNSKSGSIEESYDQSKKS